MLLLRPGRLRFGFLASGAVENTPIQHLVVFALIVNAVFLLHWFAPIGYGFSVKADPFIPQF
jgi:hypothetical protein